MYHIRTALGSTSPRIFKDQGRDDFLVPLVVVVVLVVIVVVVDAIGADVISDAACFPGPFILSMLVPLDSVADVEEEEVGISATEDDATDDTGLFLGCAMLFAVIVLRTWLL